MNVHERSWLLYRSVVVMCPFTYLVMVYPVGERVHACAHEETVMTSVLASGHASGHEHS